MNNSFKTVTKAKAHGKKVRAILGNKWRGRVWNNLGWHVCWQWGSATLYYSAYRKQYYCLVGEPDGCSGHIDLSLGDIGYSKDPKEAIRLACDKAIKVFGEEWKPIMLSVAQVRKSL